MAKREYVKVAAPATIDEARKKARIKAHHAAGLWGMTPNQLRRRCIRDEVPGAVKIGRDWWVTPQGMDAFFSPKK